MTSKKDGNGHINLGGSPHRFGTIIKATGVLSSIMESSTGKGPWLDKTQNQTFAIISGLPEAARVGMVLNDDKFNWPIGHIEESYATRKAREESAALKAGRAA